MYAKRQNRYRILRHKRQKGSYTAIVPSALQRITIVEDVSSIFRYVLALTSGFAQDFGTSPLQIGMVDVECQMASVSVDIVVREMTSDNAAWS